MISEQIGSERARLKSVEQWSAHLDALHTRIAHRFNRPEVRERLRRYPVGLLGDVRRKNGWQMAEYIGERAPRGARSVYLVVPTGTWTPSARILETML
jgi:hypothetical protein